MKRETITRMLNSVDDRYIGEAAFPDPVSPRESPERIVHMKKKRIVTLALAAALILALGAAAYAGGGAALGPESAERVAIEQLAVWKEMGLLSRNVIFEGPPTKIVESPERRGGDYWYGRLFPHCYELRWYSGGEYWGTLDVDTISGKIMCAHVAASEPGTEKLFPAELTVDRFCSLLAEYWGFSGYRIEDTIDEDMYHAHWAAVDGSTLLKELPEMYPMNYYLTVFFEGDQEGAPMYVWLSSSDDSTSLLFGNAHPIG